MTNQNNQNSLLEGLELGDLKRLIHTELHVDEFKSKLGDDADVVVISFKVDGKEPAADLVSFIERGYEWCLDADVSSGEMDDGDYIVFVELDRKPEVVDNIIQLMEDLMGLTEQKLSDWRVRYGKSLEDRELNRETLEGMVPLTAEEYQNQYGQPAIDNLKAMAGVKVTTKAPKNEFTESLRIAAGIR
jgi:hypothetical protein